MECADDVGRFRCCGCALIGERSSRQWPSRAAAAMLTRVMVLSLRDSRSPCCVWLAGCVHPSDVGLLNFSVHPRMFNLVTAALIYRPLSSLSPLCVQHNAM